MKRKLHRSRRSVFGRRGMHPALKTLLWIVACVAVVALGYFGAMVISEGKLPEIEIEVGGNNSADVNKPDSTPNTDKEPDDNQQNGGSTVTPPADKPVATAEGIRAFYLPHATLLSDELDSTLSAAYNAGFNAVVFDLKDADGTMYYRFSSAQAKKVNNYAPNALTADNLTALFDLMKDNGLQPIPRLYAFCDDPAAKVLTDARIGLDSNHAWAWYDGDPNNGGKKWLNPYAPAAQDYVSALVSELKAKGAAAVMLDGVQFPAQLSSAYLGEDAATVEKNAVLTAFIGRVRGELGTDCPLLLGFSEKGALGTETKIYGGNPLTFGATVAAPTILPKDLPATIKVGETTVSNIPDTLQQTVQSLVAQMILRTKVLSDAPIVAPILPLADYTNPQIAQEIAGCLAGGTDSFILYQANGQYDFAAYH